MLVGADLPEGHPVRVAAITRHVQEAQNPNPGRAARGQANLAKMNLSPTEHATFNPPKPPAQQQTATALLPAPAPMKLNLNENQQINQAVNRFASAQLAGLDKQLGSFKGGRLPSHVESALGLHIVGMAHQYLGTPYLWGGTTPRGFDCSGFAQFLYAKSGISIPRTSEQQWMAGSPVPKRALQPGDLVFFRGSDSVGGLPGHVGVYIGHGMMIDEPHTGSHARVESVFSFGGYMGARRYGK